jgi:hypothetical protein
MPSLLSKFHNPPSLPLRHYLDVFECNYSVQIKDTEFPICGGKGVKIDRVTRMDSGAFAITARDARRPDEGSVILRDEAVWRFAAERVRAPIVMTLSGGYARRSAAVVVDSISNLFDKFGLVQDSNQASDK